MEDDDEHYLYESLELAVVCERYIGRQSLLDALEMAWALRILLQEQMCKDR